MDRNLALEIAKVIGEPINRQLPTAALIEEMAEVDVVDPAELIRVYQTEDPYADEIATVDADGSITQVKISPNTPTIINPSGLQSHQEYVLLHEILNTPDAKAFERRRNAIERAMDKKEVYELFALIKSASSQVVAQGSTEDIYDVIEKMVALVEPYGDDIILYAGVNAFREIRKYVKANARHFRYVVDLMKDMKDKLGISELKKVVGEFKVDGGGSTLVLGVNEMVLVARTSVISSTKPLAFVRRRISPDLASIAGLTVDQKAQRAVIVTPTPIPLVAGSKVVSGYGCWGFEERVAALINKRCVASTTITATVDSEYPEETVPPVYEA
jgi:hypothetical protein